MKRAGPVLLLATILFVSAFFSRQESAQSLLFSLSYLLFSLLFISLIWTWINIRSLRLERISRSRRTQVGRAIEERFSLSNLGVLPALWVEIIDQSDLPEHRASHVVTWLRYKRRYDWRVNTVCLRRGRYILGPISLTTGDPFGFFQMKKDIQDTRQLIVYPRTYSISRFPLPMGMLQGGDALRRRTHQITANASGVREYAPGDSFSRIHWRSTARRDQLIVKEFELDPLADIWIMPDLFQGVQATYIAPEEIIQAQPTVLWTPLSKYQLDPSTEEYTIAISASLAQHFLRLDRAVGMLLYADERQVIQTDRGERQLSKILETLAVIRASGALPVHNMIQAEIDQIPRGSTIIVVTPSTHHELAVATRMLMRRGVRAAVILVDPESFGADRSSRLLLGLLQGSLTPTILVNDSDDLESS
ncbi:MAG: DUF58 domain-containing protein, partial [Chloroflexota bacterium]